MNKLKLLLQILLLCVIFMIILFFIISSNLSNEHLSITPIFDQKMLSYLCLAGEIVAVIALFLAMYIISKFQNKIDEMQKEIKDLEYSRNMELMLAQTHVD